MAHQWKAGDLAKCVDAQKCPVYPSSTRVSLGAIYRVVGVKTIANIYGEDCVGLKLDRDNCIHPVTGMEGHENVVRFRPVLPAEPAFTEAMRSLKPRVEA